MATVPFDETQESQVPNPLDIEKKEGGAFIDYNELSRVNDISGNNLNDEASP